MQSVITYILIIAYVWSRLSKLTVSFVYSMPITRACVYMDDKILYAHFYVFSLLITRKINISNTILYKVSLLTE